MGPLKFVDDAQCVQETRAPRKPEFRFRVGGAKETGGTASCVSKGYKSPVVGRTVNIWQIQEHNVKVTPNDVLLK